MASGLGLQGQPPLPGLPRTGKDWDMHSVEGVREQIRTKAHEDNLKRGCASNFVREAFAMWMELSRAGFHPLDPGWEAGCVLETQKEGKGFQLVVVWPETGPGCWLDRERRIKPEVRG